MQDGLRKRCCEHKRSGLLTTVFFAVFAIAALASSASGEVSLDRIVAIVNNDVITWSELYAAMEFEVSKQGRRLDEGQKMEIFRESEEPFLAGLIDARLQAQEAERLGIGVSEAELDNAVSDIKRRFSLDDEAFLKALAKDGFRSLKHYREVLRDQILISRVIEQEVKGKAVKESASETGEKGGDFYRLSQIFFRIPDEGEKALEGKIAFVLDGLKAGEDFEALASRYSEDATASIGGDLGYIEKENLAPEFSGALEGLKPGGVSNPFRTGLGLHIVKLEEIKSAGQFRLEERFQKLYRGWVAGLRDKAVVEIRL